MRFSLFQIFLGSFILQFCFWSSSWKLYLTPHCWALICASSCANHIFLNYQLPPHALKGEAVCPQIPTVHVNASDTSYADTWLWLTSGSKSCRKYRQISRTELYNQFKWIPFTPCWISWKLTQVQNCFCSNNLIHPISASACVSNPLLINLTLSKTWTAGHIQTSNWLSRNCSRDKKSNQASSDGFSALIPCSKMRPQFQTHEWLPSWHLSERAGSLCLRRSNSAASAGGGHSPTPSQSSRM